ncbi:MAG: energy transducer TonB [Tannerellaceae bacterium]|jgi:TonB family protein|nr:energy transducer TonB [Tannerellaceae bacterium]
MAAPDKTPLKVANNKQHVASLYGWVGALAFHALLFLLLWLSVLRSKVPEKQEGVLIHFGAIDAGAGTFEPQETPVPSETDYSTTSPEPAPPQPVPPEPLVTQNVEESVAIPDDPNKEKEEARRQEEENKRKEAERIRKEKEAAIARRISGAFGTGNSAGANVNNAEYGSFSLSGRTLGANGLPRPEYVVQEEGKIVVNITVNPQGGVIFAEIGRGTTIDNEAMRRSAIEAARRATFNSIESTHNQSGAITYVYNLK